MTAKKIKKNSWSRFQEFFFEFPRLGMAIDLSRTDIDFEFIKAQSGRIERALSQMSELEAGGIANPDENRMVGHYWLRNPSLSPTLEIRAEIEETINAIETFTSKIHSGKICGESGRFRNCLAIGIGGSALAPQFFSDALGEQKTEKLKFYSLDNTDPDGINRTFSILNGELGKTLCLVSSKSGKTRETYNCMIETKTNYEQAGLNFNKHAVAVTETGSELHNYAVSNDWIKTFPIWDWVGGRTSAFSPVGLLPAALQGFDFLNLTSGACLCDEQTRAYIVTDNPAMLLALSWFFECNGKGKKFQIILPYKDSLLLFPRYAQQLIMESLGKKYNENGIIVSQGLSVYGNKGSTDQHSYIQQLMEGMNNFFVTFIEVLKDHSDKLLYIEPNIKTGDYLNAFYLGTRNSLYENGRHSITITLDDVTPFSVGSLIALYERAVGYYASFIGVNAYHQPSVELGKEASMSVIGLQKAIIALLLKNRGKHLNANQIAKGVGANDKVESVFKICYRLAANQIVSVIRRQKAKPFSLEFGIN